MWIFGADADIREEKNTDIDMYQPIILYKQNVYINVLIKHLEAVMFYTLTLNFMI